MQFPSYVSPNKQYYSNNGGLYSDGINSFYAFYQPPTMPPPAPPPPPPIHGGILYFDQLTGQYFYQKNAQNSSQTQFYYDHINSFYSNQSPNNIYAFYDDRSQNLNDNDDNSEEDTENGSKASSNVIITEVSDEEEDEIEINIRNRAKKKDYVDAISLNEEDNNIENNNNNKI
jgi:hypothetical protein